MKRSPSRRAVLKGALAAAGGLAAFAGLGRNFGGLSPIALATAAEVSDRYFIFCYFSGGWDLLISLDPRDPAVFREDVKKVTRIQPGYHLLPSGNRDLVATSVPGMTFGPYIGNLVDHADKMALIRGMSMDTLTHEVGRRRFLTGKAPAGLQARGSSMATVMAAQ
ncbi:MAG: transcriptional initiation protein Tat, partial [Myxococcota bacterium]